MQNESHQFFILFLHIQTFPGHVIYISKDCLIETAVSTDKRPFMLYLQIKGLSSWRLKGYLILIQKYIYIVHTTATYHWQVYMSEEYIAQNFEDAERPSPMDQMIKVPVNKIIR